MKSFVLLSVFILFVSCINPDVAVSYDAIELAGDVGAMGVPVAALIMTYAHNDKEGAIEFARAYVTSTAVTYGLKYTVNEKTPKGEKHSFPSGHTSSAFSGATFIQQRYGWTSGVPAYLAASFVGYSRIHSRNHRFGDVVAGAAIGFIPNLIFTKPYKDVTVTPSVSRNFTGIMIGKKY